MMEIYSMVEIPLDFQGALCSMDLVQWHIQSYTYQEGIFK
jgi:hypothetical protein